MRVLPDAPAKRASRLPLPDDHWWRGRIAQAMDAWARQRGIRLPGWRELAAEVTKLGHETDDVSVSRCVKGSHITWELALPISDVLGVPRPAVISTSEEHAVALASAPVVDEIRSLLGQLRSIEERAGSPSQTPRVEPEHGARQGVAPVRDRREPKPRR